MKWQTVPPSPEWWLEFRAWRAFRAWALRSGERVCFEGRYHDDGIASGVKYGEPCPNCGAQL
ncbi:MAG: hypothetical protein ACXVXZ_13890 [Mycobacteriaceae bacterium]